VQKFLKHKRIYRIITECRSRHSCRNFFKNLKLLPLQSQYILSFLLFVVNNTNKFKLNSDVHHINTGRYSPVLNSQNANKFNSMKSSQAVNHIKVWIFSNAAGTEAVPETLENFHTLFLLSVQEDFIEFSHCKNFKSYINSIQFSTFKF
jgi:hypothetical protein